MSTFVDKVLDVNRGISKLTEPITKPINKEIDRLQKGSGRVSPTIETFDPGQKIALKIFSAMDDIDQALFSNEDREFREVQLEKFRTLGRELMQAAQEVGAVGPDQLRAAAAFWDGSLSEEERQSIVSKANQRLEEFLFPARKG